MRCASRAAFLVLLACGSARADLVVTVQRKSLRTDPPVVEMQQIKMTRDKLTTTVSERAGSSTQIIFRGDQGLVWALDTKTRTYMEIDKATMQSAGDQMSAAMKQVQEQLAKLPPEQRAMAEKMMQGQVPGMAGAPGAAGGPGASAAPGGATPALEVKATGEKRTIQGYACTRYDVFWNGKKMSESWVAPWSEAKVKKEDLEALRSMAGFFEDLVESNPMLRGMSENSTYRGADRMEGFPVLVRRYDGDKVVEETMLENLERKSVEASAFEVPAGFSKKQPGLQE